jgi:FkbM family methyltransferase
MRERVITALVALYERVLRTGVLDRPRGRRAFEFVYMGYKQLLEAGPVDGLRAAVASGSTVIDVGANIGFFSMRFARWVGPTGRVIAIEPERQNIRSLRDRVARAHLSAVVDCVHAAAADQSGSLKLAVTPGHPGNHHLSDDGETVQAVTLDALIADESRPVSLIKIDVQGAEAMVIAGAQRLLERHRPAIYVEIDAPSLQRLGSSPQELIDTIVARGYQPHRLTRDGVGSPEAVSDLRARTAHEYIDVLFLPA